MWSHVHITRYMMTSGLLPGHKSFTAAQVLRSTRSRHNVIIDKQPSPWHSITINIAACLATKRRPVWFGPCMNFPCPCWLHRIGGTSCCITRLGRREHPPITHLCLQLLGGSARRENYSQGCWSCGWRPRARQEWRHSEKTKQRCKGRRIRPPRRMRLPTYQPRAWCANRGLSGLPAHNSFVCYAIETSCSLLSQYLLPNGMCALLQPLPNNTRLEEGLITSPLSFTLCSSLSFPPSSLSYPPVVSLFTSFHSCLHSWSPLSPLSSAGFFFFCSFSVIPPITSHKMSTEQQCVQMGKKFTFKVMYQPDVAIKKSS